MRHARIRPRHTDTFMSTRVDRRVRYWVDGLVIGSDVFVKTLVGQVRGEWTVSKRRLTRGASTGLVRLQTTACDRLSSVNANVTVAETRQ